LDIISGDDISNHHPNQIFILPEERDCVPACRKRQDGDIIHMHANLKAKKTINAKPNFQIKFRLHHYLFITRSSK
jgi:hypothetical protein